MKTYNKICPICNKSFSNTTGGNKCTICNTRIRRMKLKIQCVEYKNSKCLACGHTNLSSLDFHHLDPKLKDFEISRRRTYYTFEKLKQELDKCVLLCSNCHRDLHNGLYLVDSNLNIKDTSMESKYIKYLNLAKERLETEKTLVKKPSRYCSICNRKLRYEQKKYCSRKCSHKTQFKVVRPDYEHLLKELSESNYVQIGKKYGVSDNAVRKWIKTYEKSI